MRDGVDHAADRRIVGLNDLILVMPQPQGAEGVSLPPLRPESALHLADPQLLTHASPPES